MFRRPSSTLATRLTQHSIVAMLVLAACGGDNGAAPKASTKDRTIQAGVSDANDKNIVVMEFLPVEATVEVGSEVTWRFPGAEPHTVTFVPAGAKRPLPSDADANKAFPATGAYDGTTKVSSGLIGAPEPATFKLAFSKAGSYAYFCTIHPLMDGKLNVVAAGQKTDTQAEIRSRARTEATQFVNEGRTLKQQVVAKQPKQSRNSDGSTTWTVEMGASSEHTSVTAFSPVTVNLRKGDKALFVNNDTLLPHTASFGGPKVPKDPESPEAINPAPGRSPQTLNATGYFNTGWLPPNPPGGGPALAARSFTFSIPAAGTYAYVCILHAPSGHAGTIIAN